MSTTISAKYDDSGTTYTIGKLGRITHSIHFPGTRKYCVTPKVKGWTQDRFETWEQAFKWLTHIRPS